MDIKLISNATLKRLPVYLRCLHEMASLGEEYVSSVAIAENLKLNSVQVKKDIAVISSSSGKPKVGFKLSTLIHDIENFLGYTKTQKACLIGVGKLGSALLSYKGFEKYGLQIVGAFDINEQLFGNTINGISIYSTSELTDFVKQNQVYMAVLAVREKDAQFVCDQLVPAGIIGILNFAPANLQVPQGVFVQDVDIAASLAVLSTKVKTVLENK